MAAALQRLARLLAEMAATRAGLAIADAAEAGKRAGSGVVLAIVSVLSGFLMAAFAAVAILVCLWDSHRVAAAIAIPLVFAGVGIAACLLAARAFRNAPRAFAATLETLRTDREALLGADDEHREA